MRKIIALLLSLLLLCTAAMPVFAEETLPDPVYTLENVKFADGALTGTVVHDDTTAEAAKLYVRVTYFKADGSTAIVQGAVVDGAFTNYVSGSIVAIAVILTDKKGTPNMQPDTFKHIAVSGLVVSQ